MIELGASCVVGQYLWYYFCFEQLPLLFFLSCCFLFVLFVCLFWDKVIL